MRLIFAGTPEFAAKSLAALIQAGHDIALVLTQPDRPAGRGMKLKQSAVKKIAIEHNISVAQPASLKEIATQIMLKDINADVMVVVAYGLILPENILKIPRYGCVNIHASLLPRWRGAAPIQRAIESGDKCTGISIMQMDSGLDTGDILNMSTLAINDIDNAASLTESLANLGASAIVKTLENINKITPIKQAESGVCYAAKISKAEAEINWKDNAENIVRRIRAFNPMPGAYSFVNGKLLKIWQSSLEATKSGEAGQVLELNNGIVIATGSGSICATELQMAGAKRLIAKDFISGNNLQIGDFLGK